MARAGWGAEDIGDLTGRTALVTGANSGLGLETAAVLAAHGAFTVLGCRNPDAARRAAERIMGEHRSADVATLELDLASLASVREAAGRFGQRHDRLDILVNNAGVMASPRRVTEDGFELQLGTNHLGHFALTGLLCDLLLVTQGSRVVTVSSVVHRIGRLDPDHVGPEGHYGRWSAYGRSKLANLLFTLELARRLAEAGAPTIAVGAHPGWAATNLVANGPAMGAPTAVRRASRLISHLGQSAAAGALPTLYAATAPDVANGDYFGPGGFAEQFGAPVRVRPSARARRPADARRLFDVSAEMTGVSFPLPVPAGSPG
ncbi:MAG TPA: oxidoreductase [Acidimicrobiales bacterium]|nr:oxidoreductase [Acidimicrobiales bacterium]